MSCAPAWSIGYAGFVDLICTPDIWAIAGRLISSPRQAPSSGSLHLPSVVGTETLTGSAEFAQARVPSYDLPVQLRS